MKKLLSVVVIAATLSLAGCADLQPSPEQMAAADYGNQPSATEATSLVQAYLQDTLIDPNSLILRGPTKLERGWMKANGRTEFGYLAYFGVNAKNRMGGYTGSIPKAFFIKNGSILATYTVYTDGLRPDL
ncbi:hypothetical protein [Burkholderia vietnamiensis]|uniref:hypothetical protein n=1 Tax=Burkholderia TaxID=32008 RepID=UPI002652F078|nr:hypothetical protein [Burkholderia vietnamiensis]MDN7669676.1 hypothetical protein [Burkholderia vietnamiensis]